MALLSEESPGRAARRYASDVNLKLPEPPEPDPSRRRMKPLECRMTAGVILIPERYAESGQPGSDADARAYCIHSFSQVLSAGRCLDLPHFLCFFKGFRCHGTRFSVHRR